jgi:hypothetical protein
MAIIFSQQSVLEILNISYFCFGKNNIDKDYGRNLFFRHQN